MPRIEDTILSTVFYVYPSEVAAREGEELGATGFFFFEKSKTNPLKGHMYAVTNLHVIFRNGMEEPVLRVNTTSNKFDTIKTSKDNWIRHPNGDDVVICPIQLNKVRHDYGYFDRGMVLDSEFLLKNNIGPGDDVFMVGRFRVRAGKEKNLPTVRFGCLAAMNDEPLYNPYTLLEQESFIVEMKSISGYSGSPVVVFIEPYSLRWIHDEDTRNPLHFKQRLLGINWGHIRYWEYATLGSEEKIRVEMDSSMAGVVPVWKIMDLIDSEELIERRKVDDDKIKKELEDSHIS